MFTVYFILARGDRHALPGPFATMADAEAEIANADAIMANPYAAWRLVTDDAIVAIGIMF